MIKAEGLTRTYGSYTAVDGVSFSIKQGEIVGLLGHNGAGKTTIMKMLTGFLEPTSGAIQVDGLDIAHHLGAVQRKMGYLPENCPLYPEMTIIDYLEYTAGLHGVPESSRIPAVRDAIRQTELTDKAAQSIGTLSRGYRQRVGVAQAILHKPQILVLDEPTNGLDPSQIQHMRSLIQNLAENATLIISTHILQEVQAVCGRVIIIRNGHLALDARLNDLRGSRRLLVSSNAPPEEVSSLLGGLQPVRTVKHLDSHEERHDYALEVGEMVSPEAVSELAPRVAQTVLGKGYHLFALHPEHRDLETVFGEINAADEKNNAGKGAIHG